MPTKTGCSLVASIRSLDNTRGCTVDEKIANYIISALELEKAQHVGAIIAVIGSVVVILLGFSDLDVFLIAALLFVSGSVLGATVIETRLKSKSQTAVLAQSPTDRIE